MTKPRDLPFLRDDAQPMVSLRGVSKAYRSGARPTIALQDVWADFEPAQMHAIVGKSGAGKSTLINMIAGIDRATSGEIYVAGTPIHNLGEDALAGWRGQHVGVVYQSFELLPSLSLLDNIMLPIQFAGRYDPRQTPQWAMSLLEQVGLAEHAFKRPGAISGGQRQRAAIARALANQPDLLVADEPTGSLDSATAQSILDLLASLVAGGMTVILVTHDPAVAEAAQSVTRLVDGRLHDQALPVAVAQPHARSVILDIAAS